MRDLDIQYPIHREEFLKQMSKQMTLLSMGYDGDDFKGKKRGRKPTKLSKNIETKPNTKMYASRRY